MHKCHFFLASLCLAPGIALADGREQPALRLKNGDRVVLLGSALIEHEHLYGYLETRLTERHPDAAVTFRNFGWSGDTVAGSARTSGFQNPDGMARLLKEVYAFEPTVIFLGYGANESFGGEPGLPRFVQGFTKLLNDLAPLKARSIILSPTFHEDLGRPFPDPGGHNQQLELYTSALAKTASERKMPFVDLFHPLLAYKKTQPRTRLMTNGLLPNDTGYWLIAREIEDKLLGGRPAWRIELDRDGRQLRPAPARVDGFKANADGIRLALHLSSLPAPAWAGESLSPTIRVKGLPDGRYVLRVNDRPVQEGTAEEWDKGVKLASDPFQTQTEQLRAAIIKKGRLFARRWRPFNDHDRHWGFIGGDFKLYDREIAEEERVIANLRRPRPLRCEIAKKETAR